MPKSENRSHCKSLVIFGHEMAKITILATFVRLEFWWSKNNMCCFFWVPRSFWGTKSHQNIQFLYKKSNFYAKIFIGTKLRFIDFFMIFRQNWAIFEGKNPQKMQKSFFFQIPSETISRKSVLTIARL